MHNINRLIVFFLLACLCMDMTAAPRNKALMEQAAERVLRHSVHPGMKTEARRGNLKMLASNKAFTIYGYDGGGFAIISNDDLVPEVLGYSQASFSQKDNPSFQWYLQTAEKAVNAIVQSGRKRTTTAPDASRFKASVAPMITCHWGQEAPYNNLCPIGTASGTGSWQGYGGTGRCVTGCVATAMAQILYYHKWPEHGQGTHSVSVLQADRSHTTVSVDFSQSTYDWANMLDDYSGNYTQEQGNAVAKLMLDCGVASDMQYATDGSGTYTYSARDGLVRNFGYPETATYYERSNFSERQWMEMIYNEMSNDRPVLYGGVDNYNGGHEFVLCGYDTEGRVWVNWGWEGSDEGYYDIALLNPETYSFSSDQDMVIGIESDKAADVSDTLNVSQPGELRQLIPDSIAPHITALKVRGAINSTDVKYLRSLAGLDSAGVASRSKLRTLDLSEAGIVSGGEDYLIEGSHRLNTQNGTFPERAFYGSSSLRTLLLPERIDSLGLGALSGMSALDSVALPASLKKYYALKDNILYNSDTTEVEAVLPHAASSLMLASGTRVVRPYAFSAMRGVKNVTLPLSLDSVGSYAFASASGLSSIKVMGKRVPRTGVKVFSGINAGNVTLYVRSGMSELFKRSANWKELSQNISEFGTTIRVRNALKTYGDENPRFGYRIYGDYVDGKPILSCEATALSPAGDYVIHAEKGTITDESVDFEDGTLTIMKAMANLRALDDTIEAGQALHGLYAIDSLRNGETTVELTTQPVFEVTDSLGHPLDVFTTPGVYNIRVSGAESLNYEFSYFPAHLLVIVPTGISTLRSATLPAADGIYTLTGQRISLKGATISSLPKGIYIINGKKTIIK